MTSVVKGNGPCVRREAMAGDVSTTLSAWIDSARYPIHSRLPSERALAHTLSVTRSQVREALQKLEMDGRIWRHVGMGTYVGCRPSSVHSTPESLSVATTLTEFLEARSLIEPVVARLAAVRADQYEINMISKYFSHAREASNWDDWETWDGLFHRAIAEASGNGILISSIDQLLRIRKHSRWTFSSIRFDPKLVNRYSDEHATLMVAIANGDPDGAEDAMGRHMRGLCLTVGPKTTLKS